MNAADMIVLDLVEPEMPQCAKTHGPHTVSFSMRGVLSAKVTLSQLGGFGASNANIAP